MRKLKVEFYCMCDGDCGNCPRSRKKRYMCIRPRAAECHTMVSPEICPCLLIKGGD